MGVPGNVELDPELTSPCGWLLPCHGTDDTLWPEAAGSAVMLHFPC